MQLFINVTAKNIDVGIRKCKWGCPIACALHDAHPTAYDLLVAKRFLRFTHTEVRERAVVRHYLAAMPKIAKEFIRDFDRKREVHPFSFTATFEEAGCP